MRPGDAAAGPDFADQRAGGDLLPGMHENGRQVAVHRDQSLAMIDQDRIAIEEITAGVDYAAAGSRVHCGSERRGNVHAGVRVTRFAVEDAARAKRAGTHAFDRRQQPQRCRRPIDEAGERLVQMVVLTLDTRKVLL